MMHVLLLYAQLLRSGAFASAMLPHCRHLSAVCGHAHPAGRGACHVDVDKLRQEVSRHRYKYAPPDTPEGFWDLDF